MNTDELKAELGRVMETGDDAALEKFLIDHFKEFPRDIQGSILLEFYTDALEKRAGEHTIARVQEVALKLLKHLEYMKTQLEKRE
jgi:hypothetical protein